MVHILLHKNEATCVVFGMPMKAIQAGAVKGYSSFR